MTAPRNLADVPSLRHRLHDTVALQGMAQEPEPEPFLQVRARSPAGPAAAGSEPECLALLHPSAGARLRAAGAPAGRCRRRRSRRSAAAAWVGLFAGLPSHVQCPAVPSTSPQQIPLDWKKLLPRRSGGGGGAMGDLPWTEPELIAQCQREYEEAAAHGGQVGSGAPAAPCKLRLARQAMGRRTVGSSRLRPSRWGAAGRERVQPEKGGCTGPDGPWNQQAVCRGRAAAARRLHPSAACIPSWTCPPRPSGCARLLPLALPLPGALCCAPHSPRRPSCC